MRGNLGPDRDQNADFKPSEPITLNMIASLGLVSRSTYFALAILAAILLIPVMVLLVRA